LLMFLNSIWDRGEERVTVEVQGEPPKEPVTSQTPVCSRDGKRAA
jgi:hypothetical protein